MFVDRGDVRRISGHAERKIAGDSQRGADDQTNENFGVQRHAARFFGSMGVSGA